MKKTKRINVNDEKIIIEVGSDQECTVAYSNIDFSVEPSNEKDFDIYLMTGKNNGKGGDNK